MRARGNISKRVMICIMSAMMFFSSAAGTMLIPMRAYAATYATTDLVPVDNEGKKNLAADDILTSNTGEINENLGRIDSNSGTVVNNSGTVDNNSGTVVSNSGTVTGGIVTTNQSTGTATGATVTDNYGTVNGDSAVTNNFGTADGATVTNNYGNAVNSNVSDNYGTADDSSVANNWSSGTVTGNSSVENEYGGTVGTNVTVEHQFASNPGPNPPTPPAAPEPDPEPESHREPASRVETQVPSSGKIDANAPTREQIRSLESYIAEDAASKGYAASAKLTVSITFPDNYKGGTVPFVLEVPGLSNVAKNVYAYILAYDGKVYVVECTVRNGFVGFYAPVAGVVSIVEMDIPQAAVSANAAANAAIAPVQAANPVASNSSAENTVMDPSTLGDEAYVAAMVDKVNSAAPGGAVETTVSDSGFIDSSIISALSSRNDVTVKMHTTVNGAQYDIDIPAATDLSKLVGPDGRILVAVLIGKLGRKVN